MRPDFTDSFGSRRPKKGAVAWAWLTRGGNLAPCENECEARRLCGRGVVALVKITLKRPIAFDMDAGRV